MEFVKTSQQAESGPSALKERLVHELGKDKHVLWLVSGGSNIEASVRVMAELPADKTKNLPIFLIDERYGEVGHFDSNAKQLIDAGFQAQEAIFVPALAPGFSLEETRERYEAACKRAFEHADVVIAQIGIGSDGHIAGILPHSAAVDASGWVTAYDTATYKRITLTFDALRKVTAAYVFAFGDEKKPTLERLRDTKASLSDQPAQLLKELPEVYIYNDQIEEKES
jgi:6-phosphogluconolactonase/glucosamine-6-phosphate isomerase/deaminase